MSYPNRATLLMSMEAAVPLYTAELMSLQPHPRGRRAVRWAGEAEREVVTRGHQLTRRPAERPRPRGETARLFNLVARGVAALSLQPGGLVALGRLWCARHYPAGVISMGDPTCPRCAADGGNYRAVEELPPRQRAAAFLTRLGDAL